MVTGPPRVCRWVVAGVVVTGRGLAPRKRTRPGRAESRHQRTTTAQTSRDGVGLTRQAGSSGQAGRSGPCALDIVIGDVLLRRELRCPPDHWGRTAVVWGKSTFWAQIAVLDPPGFACRTRPPAPWHCRAGAAPQNPRMESSKALSSVMASLCQRMRAASACLPAHSRTDA